MAQEDKPINNKKHFKSIGDSLVFSSDIGDLIEASGVDFGGDIDLENMEHVRKIREILEGDDTVYDMTDEEVQAELKAIQEQLKIEAEDEETGTTLGQRVAAEYFECEPADVEESGYDHYGLPVYKHGEVEVAIGDNEQARAAVEEYIKGSLWGFRPKFVIEHSKAEWSKELEEALILIQETLCEKSQPFVEAFITDIDQFIEDAIKADGRGVFLSPYDSQEIEIEYNDKTFYAYRV